jgi:hypothetical protein
MRHAADATVDPMPPVVGGALPWVDAGIGLLRDPTSFFLDARRRHGDTFVIDAFGFRLFCVFSPAGVRRLYELAEREASFGPSTKQSRSSSPSWARRDVSTSSPSAADSATGSGSRPGPVSKPPRRATSTV